MRIRHARLSRLLCLATFACASRTAGQDGSFRLGDVNLDGRVSLGDILHLNAYLCLYGTQPGCLAAVDANANGTADLGDAMAIYNAIFLGDGSGFQPSLACISTPQGSPLTCDAGAACVEPAPPSTREPVTVFVSSEPDASGPPQQGVGLFGHPGELFELPFHVYLAGELGSGQGAQGWSLGVRPESDEIDVSIVEATHEGTDAWQYFLGGVARTWFAERGATTAITLSIVEHRVLPASPQVVLSGRLRIVAPPRGEAGTVMLRVVDGLAGPGGPVSLEVGDATELVRPVSVPLKIYLESPAAFGRFIRGDANQDRAHDISDVLTTLGALFLGTVTLTCPDAADANDDGKIDIGDPVLSLGCLFLGAGCPASPFPACGDDPTADDPFTCDAAGFTCL